MAFACFFGVAAAFLGNAKSVDLAGLTLTTTTLAAFAALFAACDNIFHFRARKNISLNAEGTLAREHPIFKNISGHSLSKLRVVLLTDVITRSAIAIIFAGIVLFLIIRYGRLVKEWS
ncbi:MAG: hypothetical protein U5L06_06625 [Rhodovibrio sp.]|nr:hypothetical protein [Rhodovibrio sp.]